MVVNEAEVKREKQRSCYADGYSFTATTDNIDVSGRSDMHGTSITLIGHLSKDNKGSDPLPLNFDV